MESSQQIVSIADIHTSRIVRPSSHQLPHRHNGNSETSKLLIILYRHYNSKAPSDKVNFHIHRFVLIVCSTFRQKYIEFRIERQACPLLYLKCLSQRIMDIVGSFVICPPSRRTADSLSPLQLKSLVGVALDAAENPAIR